MCRGFQCLEALKKRAVITDALACLFGNAVDTLRTLCLPLWQQGFRAWAEAVGELIPSCDAEGPVE